MSEDSLLRLKLLGCTHLTETLPAAEQLTLVTLLTVNVIKGMVTPMHFTQVSALIAQAVVMQLKDSPSQPPAKEPHFDMYFSALQDAARHSPNMLKHINDSKEFIKDAFYAGAWQGMLVNKEDAK